MAWKRISSCFHFFKFKKSKSQILDLFEKFVLKKFQKFQKCDQPRTLPLVKTKILTDLKSRVQMGLKTQEQLFFVEKSFILTHPNAHSLSLMLMLMIMLMIMLMLMLMLMHPQVRTPLRLQLLDSRRFHLGRSHQ